MNLVIDDGNSATKVGIFDHQTLLEKHAFNSKDELSKFLTSSAHENVIICSVKGEGKSIAEMLQYRKKVFIVDHTLPLPITNHYKTPNTLGVDRLAGVCGATEIFPFEHCLVIDSGTCITFDFIDREKNYLGGGISPGMNMRFKAMHTFTAKLPLISPRPDVPLVGASTEECMQSGVVNGIIAEMNGIIEQYNQKYSGVRVILCGGDTGFFENQLKASIFASPELVLIGLNSILNYNVKQ
jgi:type III pantothenate kinase